jgi:hypothetical protein
LRFGRAQQRRQLAAIEALRGQLIDEGVDLGPRQVEMRAVDDGIFNRRRR